MKLNTNSNTYTIVYSAILVVVVAFLLSFVYQSLKPMQDKNVALDTKIHKLNALNKRDLDKADVEKIYADAFVEECNEDGVSYEVFNVDGQKKYLVPVKGQGLWGPISGYIAVDEDKNTIFGTDFQHESETAGLGALITEQKFQDSFKGKKIFAEGTDEVVISVVKSGKAGDIDASNYVDGITGATLTSNGVHSMINEGLKNFERVVK
ncbi:MAG: FMN-binding protein [Prevotellaceae bacterium]|nr:FMN-binding protein [Prevotellaceae bacterium]